MNWTKNLEKGTQNSWPSCSSWERSTRIVYSQTKLSGYLFRYGKGLWRHLEVWNPPRPSRSRLLQQNAETPEGLSLKPFISSLPWFNPIQEFYAGEWCTPGVHFEHNTFCSKMNSLGNTIPKSIMYSVYIDDLQIACTSFSLSMSERQIQLTLNKIVMRTDKSIQVSSTKCSSCSLLAWKRLTDHSHLSSKWNRSISKIRT